MAHAVSINARAGTANRCRIARRTGFSTTKVLIGFRNSKKQPCHARNIMPAARSVRRACDSPKDGNDPDTDRPPTLYKGSVSGLVLARQLWSGPVGETGRAHVCT